VAEQIAADRPKAWDRAKAACDWARRTIQYKKDAPLTGVLKAMETGTGDCNQLTSAFIAVCRAGGIPARTVRIPGHCYPEFYLADARGEGHWFATEAASDEAFGIVHGDAPILQKGDNFPLTAPDQANPRKRIEKPFRFLPESLVGTPKRGGVEPQMKLVCEPAQE
jgi:transglutaminase-like putative cysteine protease